jgi:integrase
LINEKLTDNIKSIPKRSTPRQYLTVEELVKLKNTDCPNDLLKTAFLFSALTGLRWSDISSLKWSNLKHSSDQGYYISFKQQKTGSEERLPINEQAIMLIGARQDESQKVFIGLSYSPHFKVILNKWMEQAKINKKITFHCARHSFATMLVTKDVNISTISTMLGHKDIRTTQIYAQVVDKAKIDAAKLLDIF